MEPASRTDPHQSALQCLALCARLRGMPVDAAQLLHAHPPGADVGRELLRAARALGFKCRVQACAAADLAELPLPLPVRERSGHWCVLAEADGDNVLRWAPGAGTRRMPRQQFTDAWTGEVLLLRYESAVTGNVRFGWAWFLPHVHRYRGVLAEILLASLVVQLLALLAPLFFQAVIDKVLAHHGLTTLDVLAAGLVLAALFEVLLTALRNHALAHTARRLDVHLGAHLYTHLLALPAQWFGTRPVGDIVARTRDVEHLRAFLTGPALLTLLDVLFAGVFLGALYLFNARLCAIVVAFLPLYLVLMAVTTPMLRRRLETQGRRAAELDAFLVESVSAMEALKSCAAEPRWQRRWEDLLAAQARAAWDAGQLGNVTTQVTALLGKLSQAAVLWCGARLVLDGHMTLGQLVAFNIIAARVNAPVLRIVQAWQGLQQAGVSLRRLREIFDAPREPAPPPGAPGTLPRVRGGIRFAGVTFAYHADGAPVLRDLDLEIAPGTVLGIVGPSGSGKSTLARLLQRLAVPRHGRVLLDGVDVALLEPAWLRRRVAVVQQEARLFNRSVRENITLGDPRMDSACIERAATQAGAREFILQLPRGYDTPVGEQGASLSGGQRQRLALARALAADPAVLVLDEATSALDFESEQAVQRHMAAWCRGRTVIIIAHRLSALRHAHRIAVLEGGRITALGTPADLARGDGFFARLVRAQAGS